MPLILVTNDDGYRSEGIRALAEALRRARRRDDRRAGRGSERDRPRADAAASAAARARSATASTRVDGTPTDCVNIADHAGLQAAAGSGRVRDQQGVEPRRRRDLLGNGGGRARRGAARRAGHRGLAAADARRLRLHATRRARPRRWPRRCCAAAAGADVSQHQRAEGAAEGDPRHGAGASGITSRRSPSGTIRRGGRTSGSRKGRTTGSRTIGPTTRRCATATCR